MSGNFVRERQRIVYIYNIHVYTLPLAHEISRHFWAAYGRNKWKISVKKEHESKLHALTVTKLTVTTVVIQIRTILQVCRE